ncbi:MAG: AraC family transcriptional regulator, partial [Cryomorphaceae bacterium]|nr:AraC family transcriptional regulator [Cryomorphaceae bacterium]
MREREQVIFVKNMVCQRCVLAVENLLNKQDIAYDEVDLGAIYLSSPISDHHHHELVNNLQALGFEEVVHADKRLVEEIKRLVIHIIRHEDLSEWPYKWSTFLSEHLNREYTGLSKIFSQLEGITIEHYVILQKLERVKELLMYDEMSIAQMSHILGYSSGQFLSTQFKQHTGLTPTQFKNNHR